MHPRKFCNIGAFLVRFPRFSADEFNFRLDLNDNVSFTLPKNFKWIETAHISERASYVNSSMILFDYNVCPTLIWWFWWFFPYPPSLF